MKQVELAMKVRTKKLGVLIKDARYASNKSLAECAQALGISESRFLAYEEGQSSPSLPEIELLAYFLNVPLAHFWEKEVLSKGDSSVREIDVDKLLRLRHRMIGAMMQQTRQEADVSMNDMAERIDLEPEEIEAYEFGKKPLPLPMLETLCAEFDKHVRDFRDKHGPVGVWAAEQQAVYEFLSLSPELQTFVTKPINRPYLELAQRLSEMSVDKLRAVAEGLLEITL